MSGLDLLAGLAGNWTGVNQVWLPGEAPHESQSTASVTRIVSGKFVQLAYTWVFGGEDQEGVLIFGYETAEAVVTVVWIDSWHMGDKILISRGQVEASGVVVRGSYAVEPGPDWGWRTAVEPADGKFCILMYNVTPDGQELLGVEAEYTRVE